MIMKKFTLILAAGAMLALSSPVFADDMPYFGQSPYHGDYWNAPHADYPKGPPAGAANEAARSDCQFTRVRHVSHSGNVFYRTQQICS
jgi:hypothetical protein